LWYWGFKLRVLCLLGKHSLNHAPSHFLFLVIFQIGFQAFCLVQPQTTILLPMPPTQLRVQVGTTIPTCSLRWVLNNFFAQVDFEPSCHYLCLGLLASATPPNLVNSLLIPKGKLWIKLSKRVISSG
jgi:hypothetical protein